MNSDRAAARSNTGRKKQHREPGERIVLSLWAEAHMNFHQGPVSPFPPPSPEAATTASLLPLVTPGDLRSSNRLPQPRKLLRSEKSMAGARNRLLYHSSCSSRLSISLGSWKVLVLRYFSSSVDGFGFNTGDENSRTQSQVSHDENRSPPDPLPNRPLRGQQQPERPSRNNRPNLRRDRIRNDVSDDSFLEKFKLTFDRIDKTQRGAPTAQLLQDENKRNQGQMMKEQGPPLPEDADEIFKKMKETGLIPNAVAMLDGLCKDGLIQEAMKLFGLMRERGTIPEVVIYTAVVEGFCKAHKFDDAKRIFRKMQSNGISPNAFSYTILVQGLYKCNMLDDALEFCEEMVDAGHSPNAMTFVGLVDGVCKVKGVEEAKGVIERLRQKGFIVNEKAVREFLDKKAPFSPVLWEVILGKKPSQQLF